MACRVKQGDIYMVNLSTDSIGHEQKGVRPCLAISVDSRNYTSPNIFIFPITHAKKKYQPCHYPLFKKDYPFFNYNTQYVICEEGRSISKQRLERFIGHISDSDIQNILKCKEYIFVDKS